MSLQRMAAASITTLSWVLLVGCNFAQEALIEQTTNSLERENISENTSPPPTDPALTEDEPSDVEATMPNELTLTRESFEALALFGDSYEEVAAALGGPGKLISRETFLVHAWTQNNAGVEIGFDEGKAWRIAEVMEPTPDIAAIEVGMTYDEIVSLLGPPVDTQEMLYSSYLWESSASPFKIKAAFVNAGYSFSKPILQSKSYQDAEGVENQGTALPSWDTAF